MTYRDWMSENLPGLGNFGCPRHYFSDLKNETCPMKDGTVNSCWSCWNREMKNPDSSDVWWMPEEPTETAAEAPVKDDPVKDDPVNHPSHYTSGGIECIDAIGAALCKYTDGVDAWLAGQVIKYIWRAPLKEHYKQDLEKAQFYLNRLVRRQETTE